MPNFTYDPADAVMTQPDGDYPAVLAGWDSGTSKASGDPMLTVMFTVYAPDGSMCELKEYIVKKTTFKLKRIAQALGQEDLFNSGAFDVANFMGHNITVTLGTQRQEGYDDKNVIRGYKPASATAAKSAAPGADAPQADDDLPF